MGFFKVAELGQAFCLIEADDMDLGGGGKDALSQRYILSVRVAQLMDEQLYSTRGVNNLAGQ